MSEKNISIPLIKILILNIKKILLIAFIGAITALLITFFIPKKYTSEGIVYPTSSNSIMDVVNNSNFGHEYQTDRLLQLFESQQMKEMVVKRYDLINYYELDTTSVSWRYQLNKKYSQDITFSRSKFIAVKVSASTKSPKLSANIVNDMLGYIDTIRKDILFENTYALKYNLENKVEKKIAVVDSLLKLIANENVKKTPNEIAQKLISKLEEDQREGKINFGDNIISKAAKNNYTLQNAKLINEYYTQLSVYKNLKTDLISINEKISMPFPKVYRVSSAIPDYKKSYPSFSLNLFLGFVLGLLTSILFFVIKESWVNLSLQLRQDAK